MRNGDNIYNLRGGSLVTSTWVLFANPRESDYKCDMDTVWLYSFYTIIIFFGLNFIGYFML